MHSLKNIKTIVTHAKFSLISRGSARKRMETNRVGPRLNFLRHRRGEKGSDIDSFALTIISTQESVMISLSRLFDLFDSIEKTEVGDSLHPCLVLDHLAAGTIRIGNGTNSPEVISRRQKMHLPSFLSFPSFNGCHDTDSYRKQSCLIGFRRI